MPPLRPLLLVAIAVAATCAHAASDATVRRCVEPGGVVYTDRACEAEAPAVAVTTAVTSVAGTAAPPDDPAAALQPGMSFGDAIALLGKPRETTVHWQRRRMTETWTWQRAGRSVVVTFRDGRVVAR